MPPTRQKKKETVNYFQGEIPVNAIYLLPCPCGRKIPVQPRQAGEIVTCECGTSLEVPTLLGLKTLERAEVPVEPKTAKPDWSAGHSLILLGAVIIFASIVLGGWLFWARPTDPYANFNPDQMRKLAENLTPLGSWRLWQRLESGGLEHRKLGVEIAFADQQAQHRIYWSLLAIIAGTGLTLVATGIIIMDLNKKKADWRQRTADRRKG